MKKKALITGASRGIGAAVARALAKEGYDLLLVCKSSGRDIMRLGMELEETYQIHCETALCDVSDPVQVETMMMQVGEIHVLVNNAGISFVGLLTDMSIQQWHQVMDTNLNAMFYTCRLVVPQMVRRKEGKIINVSSVWGNVGASMEVAYSASKGGVNSFTRALAKELAPSNVQVNGVAFGVIDTSMNECFSKEEIEALREDIPADRLGSTKEAGEIIRLLVNAPSYLTGQIITMDGGYI
ncbi:elongation factor P 5-aminopentanone reductase [Parablautia muri]|uniref:SDR family NAD(P)-dependent oxidoreductase n=1 Tax=Parablautia muri TaxID=2320879 RepID=A0A9X5BEV6_9FIRM|nr:SDR family NAD(P)-dependent oxidoreductase [Parablautia muri]NBJ92338.1 SDR family NAD(P)-dependent oxidoreductase [Parablautia muri]